MYDKPLKTQWIEVNGRPVPLVLPQYWDEGEEDWVVSSTQNRLPVDAQLTGSNVEDVLFDSEVITDTEYHFRKVDNVSKYKHLSLLVRNMHNEACNIDFFAIDTVLGGGIIYDKESNAINITIEAKSPRIIITKNEIGILDTPLTSLYVVVSYRNAPTEGAITLSVIKGVI